MAAKSMFDIVPAVAKAATAVASKSAAVAPAAVTGTAQIAATLRTAKPAKVISTFRDRAIDFHAKKQIAAQWVADVSPNTLRSWTNDELVQLLVTSGMCFDVASLATIVRQIIRPRPGTVDSTLAHLVAAAGACNVARLLVPELLVAIESRLHGPTGNVLAAVGMLADLPWDSIETLVQLCTTDDVTMPAAQHALSLLLCASAGVAPPTIADGAPYLSLGAKAVKRWHAAFAGKIRTAFARAHSPAQAGSEVTSTEDAATRTVRFDPFNEGVASAISRIAAFSTSHAILHTCVQALAKMTGCDSTAGKDSTPSPLLLRASSGFLLAQYVRAGLRSWALLNSASPDASVKSLTVQQRQRMGQVALDTIYSATKALIGQVQAAASRDSDGLLWTFILRIVCQGRADVPVMLQVQYMTEYKRVWDAYYARTGVPMEIALYGLEEASDSHKNMLQNSFAARRVFVTISQTLSVVQAAISAGIVPNLKMQHHNGPRIAPGPRVIHYDARVADLIEAAGGRRIPSISAAMENLVKRRVKEMITTLARAAGGSQQALQGLNNLASRTGIAAFDAAACSSIVEAVGSDMVEEAYQAGFALDMTFVGGTAKTAVEFDGMFHFQPPSVQELLRQSSAGLLSSSASPSIAEASGNGYVYRYVQAVGSEKGRFATDGLCVLPPEDTDAAPLIAFNLHRRSTIQCVTVDAHYLGQTGGQPTIGTSSSAAAGPVAPQPFVRKIADVCRLAHLHMCGWNVLSLPFFVNLVGQSSTKPHVVDRVCTTLDSVPIPLGWQGMGAGKEVPKTYYQVFQMASGGKYTSTSSSAEDPSTGQESTQLLDLVDSMIGRAVLPWLREQAAAAPHGRQAVKEDLASLVPKHTLIAYQRKAGMLQQLYSKPAGSVSTGSANTSNTPAAATAGTPTTTSKESTATRAAEQKQQGAARSPRTASHVPRDAKPPVGKPSAPSTSERNNSTARSGRDARTGRSGSMDRRPKRHEGSPPAAVEVEERKMQ